MIPKPLYLFPAVLAAGALSACSTEVISPASDGAPAGLQRSLDSLTAVLGIPGAVIAVRAADGRSYTLTSGVASLATGATVTPAARFRVASVTKPMVATVVLQLVDEGRLSLDATIGTYLPGSIANADRITVRQLLNQSAGVADYLRDSLVVSEVFVNPGRIWSVAELLEASRRNPPVAEPGAGWNYSNTHYVVLGALVEKITGRTIGGELQARVFDRLKMRNSFYATTTSLPTPFAEGYLDLDGTLNVPVGTLVSPSRSGAAGAVVSTADDLVLFGRALAAGTLLKPATQAERLRTVPASALRLPGDPVDGYYGLGVLVDDGWIGHNGSLPGYDAEVFGRTDGSVIAVTINKSFDDGTTHLIFSLVRRAQFGR